MVFLQADITPQLTALAIACCVTLACHRAASHLIVWFVPRFQRWAEARGEKMVTMEPDTLRNLGQLLAWQFAPSLAALVTSPISVYNVYTSSYETTCGAPNLPWTNYISSAMIIAVYGLHVVLGYDTIVRVPAARLFSHHAIVITEHAMIMTFKVAGVVGDLCLLMIISDFGSQVSYVVRPLFPTDFFKNPRQSPLAIRLTFLRLGSLVLSRAIVLTLCFIVSWKCIVGASTPFELGVWIAGWIGGVIMIGWTFMIMRGPVTGLIQGWKDDKQG